MDLYDAASYHQLALNAAGRSRATQRVYLIYESRFLEFLETRKIPPSLDALNAVNARQAVIWFQQRGLGKRGGEVAAKYLLSTLKTWASFLADEGVWADSPLRRVKRMRVRKLERQPYTRAEVNALLRACEDSRLPERDRLLVLLLLDTGARIGEITGLDVGDVQLDRRQVRVVGKGNRERTIPIGAPSQPDGGPLFRAFREYVKLRAKRAARTPERCGDRLLLTLAGYALTAEGGTDVIARLGETAGVEGAIPHRFRHTFATVYLTKYPGDEMGLRRIMGHLSQDALRDYTHLAQAEIARRAGRVSPTTAWLKEGGA